MLIDPGLVGDQADPLVANQADAVTHQDGDTGPHRRRRRTDMHLTRARARDRETENQNAKSHGAMTRWIAGSGIWLIGCVGAPESRPTPVATAAPIVQALRDTVRSVLTAALADSAFPGAIAVVGNRQGELIEVAVGRLTWGEPAPVDRHSLWDLASLTKVMGTAVGIMRLVDAGKVDIDQPVQRYLPDW